MGQEDVYLCLKKNKNKWMDVYDIQEFTGTSMQTITSACKKLREQQIIEYKKIYISPLSGKQRYTYKYKK